MLVMVRQRFWWPAMEEENQWFVAACTICSRHKNRHQSLAGLLLPLPIPSHPWSHIALDFITGLRPSGGSSEILTVIDCFSKSAHFSALPKLPKRQRTCSSDNGRARATTDVLEHHVFHIHGIPSAIVSYSVCLFCTLA